MRVRTVTVLIAAFAIAAQAVSAQEQDRRPGIAVFPFVSGGSYGPDSESMDALGVGLQQILMTELQQNEAVRIVERTVLREIMEEQDLGASGRVDAQTAARIGRIVGARYVVVGGFTDAFGTMRMDGRIVDVETTEVLEARQITEDREQMFDMVVSLAQQLTADADLPPLPAEVREQREQIELPAEAVEMYSRALIYEDAGRTEQAIELYSQVASQFPQYTEARQRLEQLRRG